MQGCKYTPKYVSAHSINSYTRDNLSEPFCKEIHNYSTDELPRLLHESDKENKLLAEARHADRMSQIRGISGGRDIGGGISKNAANNDNGSADGAKKKDERLRREMASKSSTRYGSSSLFSSNSNMFFSFLQAMGVEDLFENSNDSDKSGQLPRFTWIVMLPIIFLIITLIAVGGTSMMNNMIAKDQNGSGAE